MIRFIILGTLFCCLAGCYNANTIQQPKAEVKKEAVASDNFHVSYSNDKELFEASFKKVDVKPEVKKVYGAIVSHHLLSANNMAELFTSLQDQDVETIVLIGPNHFNVGEGLVLVTDWPYKTPYGQLNLDLETIDKLLTSNIVSQEEASFGQEHSISILVPYIKKTWPKAKLVPVIVKAGVNEELAGQLGLLLNKYLPEKSLVIASCDFAHHVDKTTAEKYDKYSLEVINGYRLNEIYKMAVDSPASIYALFAYLKQKEAQKFVLTENNNAAVILKAPNYNDVTSYIFGYFIKDEHT